MNAIIDRFENTLVDFVVAIPSILLALAIFWLFMWLGNRAKQSAIMLCERSNRSANLTLVVGRLAQIGVVILGILTAMTVALPSFEPAELIGLLGVSSVAIGFAFRDILENFLAGLLILLTDPFRIGDQIIVGDYEGTVEDIQLRATYLRMYDNRIVVIPNAALFTDSVTVNTANPIRRSEYEVGIGYSDDIARAQELMLRVMQNTTGVLKDPAPDTLMVAMGDSSIIIRVRWWSDSGQADMLRTQDAVLRNIKNELTNAGFDIPFPIRTVYLNNAA
jgi:small-conductance mechanosensitive channel